MNKNIWWQLKLTHENFAITCIVTWLVVATAASAVFGVICDHPGVFFASLGISISSSGLAGVGFWNLAKSDMYRIISYERNQELSNE